MAQLNITLNQDEILQLLTSNRDDAFKNLLQDSLNSILQAESTEQLKAENMSVLKSAPIAEMVLENAS